MAGISITLSLFHDFYLHCKGNRTQIQLLQHDTTMAVKRSFLIASLSEFFVIWFWKFCLFQNFTIWTALKHNLWKSNTKNIINTIQLNQKNMFQSKTKGCHTSTHTINEDYSIIDTAPCCYTGEEERCTWNANKSIYSRRILRPQLEVQQRWQHMSTLDPTWFTTPPIPIQRPQYMQNTSHKVSSTRTESLCPWAHQIHQYPLTGIGKTALSTITLNSPASSSTVIHSSHSVLPSHSSSTLVYLPCQQQKVQMEMSWQSRNIQASHPHSQRLDDTTDSGSWVGTEWSLGACSLYCFACCHLGC